MNCKRCGAFLTETDQFCMNCGTPVNETNTQNMNFENMGNNYSNQSMNNMGGQAQSHFNQQASNFENNYNQAYSYNQMPRKNNSIITFIILGIIIVVISIVIVVILVGISDSDIDSDSGLSSSSDLTQTSTSSKSAYKVNFKGFTFKIPDNLVYQESDGTLLIGDESDTWIARIEIEEGNFSQIRANKNQLQALMQQSGFISSIASEKSLGGVDWITLEVSQSGQNAIMALAKANSMYFTGITAFNQNNEFDYSLLETIAPIISSSTYTGETNNMETNTKINLSGIKELAK